MNKIKVCHFTSAHKPGDIRIFHKECVSLAKAGFDVSLVVANTEEKIFEGVKIISANVPPSGRIKRMLNTSKLTFLKALSLDADIYHFHDPELLRYALKLKKRGKIVIYDSHENVSKQIMAKFWIPKMIRPIVSKTFKRYESKVARNIDYIITATTSIKERFLPDNSNVSEIYNFPLLSEIGTVSEWGKKKQEICYVGGLSAVRGIGVLVDALEFLPNVRLNLAGSFGQGDQFEQEVKNKKGWSYVNELGFVDRSEIVNILGESKVGMVTLLPTPNHIDALAIKMFEYMGAGIPIVCSNFPLWEQIIAETNCGISVDPSNPKLVANAVTELLSNEERAKELGSNGRKAVLEKFNWSVEEKKLVAIYNQLAQTI